MNELYSTLEEVYEIPAHVSNIALGTLQMKSFIAYLIIFRVKDLIIYYIICKGN